MRSGRLIVIVAMWPSRVKSIAIPPIPEPAGECRSCDSRASLWPPHSFGLDARLFDALAPARQLLLHEVREILGTAGRGLGGEARDLVLHFLLGQRLAHDRIQLV